MQGRFYMHIPHTLTTGKYWSRDLISIFRRTERQVI